MPPADAVGMGGSGRGGGVPAASGKGRPAVPRQGPPAGRPIRQYTASLDWSLVGCAAAATQAMASWEVRSDQGGNRGQVTVGWKVRLRRYREVNSGQVRSSCRLRSGQVITQRLDRTKR